MLRRMGEGGHRLGPGGTLMLRGVWGYKPSRAQRLLLETDADQCLWDTFSTFPAVSWSHPLKSPAKFSLCHMPTELLLCLADF
jgi:hypothetical protein